MGAKESLKTWAKKINIFLNSQHPGMRKALEPAEEAVGKVNIADLQLTGWELAMDVNEKLHDFFMTFTTEEALLVVEPYVGEGFEAWRQLWLQYTSTGATEIDRTVRLFTKKACKNMAELPAAIDALDKEFKRDEECSRHGPPDHTKIALLVRLFQEKDEKELKHRWIHNQNDFQRARSDILAVAVTERLEVLNRGVKDM